MEAAILEYGQSVRSAETEHGAVTLQANSSIDSDRRFHSSHIGVGKMHGTYVVCAFTYNTIESVIALTAIK